jgi:hypothetical protein
VTALNNITTADGFTVGNTLDNLDPSQRVTLLVTNAAVRVNFRLHDTATQLKPGERDWETEEHFLPTGYFTYNAPDFRDLTCIGVRVKSGKAGVPAQVTVIVA